MPPLNYLADTALFHRLIPYVHGDRGPFDPKMSQEEMTEWFIPTVAVYRNPVDPTWDLYPTVATKHGKCSCAFNLLPLDGSFSQVASLPDGSSQTIALADKFFASSPQSSLPIGQTFNMY